MAPPAIANHDMRGRFKLPTQSPHFAQKELVNDFYNSGFMVNWGSDWDGSMKGRGSDQGMKPLYEFGRGVVFTHVPATPADAIVRRL